MLFSLFTLDVWFRQLRLRHDHHLLRHPAVVLARRLHLGAGRNCQVQVQSPNQVQNPILVTLSLIQWVRIMELHQIDLKSSSEFLVKL